MSLEQAQEFIARLKSDRDFCKYVTDFIQSSGYACTLKEIRRAEWESLMGCGDSAHCVSSNNIGEHDQCPYLSMPHGYEYWVG